MLSIFRKKEEGSNPPESTSEDDVETALSSLRKKKQELTATIENTAVAIESAMAFMIGSQLAPVEVAYRSILTSISDGVIVYDGDGKVDLSNPSVEPVLGWSPTELQGQNISALMESDVLAANFNRFFSLGPPFELQMKTKHGIKVIVECSVTILSKGDKFLGFMILRSITERMKQKQLLDSLIRSNETLLAAIDAVNVGIFVTDQALPDNPIFFANQAASDITGYSNAELLGSNPRMLQGKETDQEAVSELAHAVRMHQPAKVTLHNYRKSGEVYLSEISVTPVKDKAGRVVSWIGVFSDVTEREMKKREDDRQHRFYKTILEASPLAITIRNGDTFVFANERAKNVGLAPENLTTAVSEFFSEFTIRKLLHEDNRVRQCPGVSTFSDIVTMGGVTRHGVFTKQAVGDSIVTFFADVTDINSTKAEMKQLRKGYYKAAGSAGFGLLVFDEDSKIAFCNEAARFFIGDYSIEEMLGKTWADLMPSSSNSLDRFRDESRYAADTGSCVIRRKYTVKNSKGELIGPYDVIMIKARVDYLEKNYLACIIAMDEAKSQESAILQALPVPVRVRKGDEIIYRNGAAARQDGTGDTTESQLPSDVTLEVHDPAVKGLQAALNDSSDPILLCRMDGSVVYFNPAFDKAYGKHDNFSELVSAYHGGLYLKSIMDKVATGETWEGNMLYTEGGLVDKTIVMPVVNGAPGKVAFFIVKKRLAYGDEQ